MNKKVAMSVQAFDPSLDLFDVGHPLSLYYSAFYNLFSFCFFQFTYDDETNEILELFSNENRWEEEYGVPALRVLTIESTFNPQVEMQRKPIKVKFDEKCVELNLVEKKDSITVLNAIIHKYDPDIIMTDYGDNVILPLMVSGVEKYLLSPLLSRDSAMGVKSIESSTLVTYGRVIHRKQQSLLYGRHHIDRKNMSFYMDMALETIFEIARISGMSIQEVSRSTPGRAVASLEIIEALKTKVCIPYKKQKPEIWRDSNKFLKNDQGGIIFHPPVGVHEHVISVDFDSMFPYIMMVKNLSPETVGKSDSELGVIPSALAPLLKRRFFYKRKLTKILSISDKYDVFKNRSDALKWLLVVSFGYTGFKNAPLSSPDNFEKINQWGRKVLLDSKEIFESKGFDILHIFVDSLFVRRGEDFDIETIRDILQEIAETTSLPISLEGIYKWVVFLNSRVNPGFDVPNAYFGVFRDGSIKVRGIQCRRNDQPLIVKETQIEIIKILGKAKSLLDVKNYFPEVFDYLTKQTKNISEGRFDLDEFIISQRLSKKLDEYKMPSHAAIAGVQLEKAGIDVSEGSLVKFIYVIGSPRVIAWDLAQTKSSIHIDRHHYQKLLSEAAKTILVPFGIKKEFIENIVIQSPTYQLQLFS